tara:strand:+ start:1192 stop:1902 length:711 start_codon:yes stop_codon:yes gene_type:complete
MDYRKHYLKLIENARLENRIKGEEYFEEHHIQPRCMGGTDEKENLVLLTPEEHYIAHLLLVKMYPCEPKLLYAANMMSNRNNKSYGWVKRKFAKYHSKWLRENFVVTDKMKANMRKAQKGKKKTTEHKRAIGKANTKKYEYKGKIYFGADALKEETGVTRHLYGKYYLKGIDPEPYIGNNTYAFIKTRPKTNNFGKSWYNNGIVEKILKQCPKGWTKGRLPRLKDNKGRFKKNVSI